MSAEPENISIIRERLHKSGSTLEFKMDKVTNDVLRAVVKFLPETKGAYVVKFYMHAITIANEEDKFQLNIDINRNKLLALNEACFSKKPSVNGNVTYYSDTSGGYAKDYICDMNGKILQYDRSHSYMGFMFHIRSPGIRQFEHNGDNTLDEALSKFKKGIQMVDAGTHIDTKMIFSYKEPQPMAGQTIFDTGKIMKFRDNVDFTRADIVNAILQIKPKDGCEYSIPSTMLCILVREHMLANGEVVRDCKFLNNKIVLEEFSTDSGLYMYGKKIIDIGYILIKREKNNVYNYSFDKLDKLLLIEKTNCYSIQISDSNITIKLVDKDKQVDAGDLAYMCGMSLPKYKFEYL